VKPDKDKIHIQYDTITREVDTGAIIRNYLASVLYKGIVLRDDSLLFASVDAYLSRNRIDSLVPHFAIRKPTAIIHNTVYVYPDKPENRKPTPVTRFSAGAFVVVNPVISDAGLAASLQRKKLEIGYGYSLKGTHLATAKYTIFSR
jgi:hypothetical protein